MKNKRVLAILGSVTILVALAAIYWLNRRMYMEYHSVLTTMNRIPHVSIIKSGTFDEEFSVTNIFVTVKTEDGGVVTFQDLNMSSFNKPKALSVSRVGDWGVQTEYYSPPKKKGGFPDRSSESGINLLTGIPSSIKRPSPPVRNVQDAVEHYREVLAYVENLPDYEHKTIEKHGDNSQSVTWKFHCNSAGSASGWCGNMKMQCIEEWGDDHRWCHENQPNQAL